MSSWLHYQELLLIKMSPIYNLSSYSQSFPTNSVVISPFAEKVANQQNTITGRSHCYHLFETFALTSSSLIDFPKNQLTPGIPAEASRPMGPDQKIAVVPRRSSLSAREILCWRILPKRLFVILTYSYSATTMPSCLWAALWAVLCTSTCLALLSLYIYNLNGRRVLKFIRLYI